MNRFFNLTQKSQLLISLGAFILIGKLNNKSYYSKFFIFATVFRKNWIPGNSRDFLLTINFPGKEKCWKTNKAPG